MSLSSRRKPYPYDIEIAGKGYMLEPQEGGLLVGRRIQTLENVVPTEYTYSSQPPYSERACTFGPLVNGMGEKVQASAIGQRYRYALYADCSIGGRLIKGPYFTMITPPYTGDVRGGCEFTVAGVKKMLVIAGRYCLVRNGDNAADWAVSKDFGAGRIATSIVRFRDAAGTDAVYVGLDNGDLWQFTGASDTTTWTQCSLPAGRATGAAFLEVVRDEFWYGAGNKISKSETNPLLASNWSGWITIGDSTNQITCLRQHLNQLFIFKSNGIYTVDFEGGDVELFPGLGALAGDFNGRNAFAWFNAIYVPYGPIFYKLIAGTVAQLMPTGLERLMDNDSEVAGNVTCSVGHGTWFLYVGLQNPLNQCSYLLKLGSWVPPKADTDADYTFVEALHGALYKWINKTISWLHISDVPGPNLRLYAGFTDGAIGWALLPRQSPDPTTDANCRFCTEVGEVHWPRHHAMFEADRKVYRRLSVYASKVDTGNYVRFKYRTRQDAYTDLGVNFTADAQTGRFPDNTLGEHIDLVTQLYNSANTATPVLDTVVLHESVLPAMLLEYELAVRAESYQARRDGVSDRRSAEQIRNDLRQVASSQALAEVTMPDEESQVVSIVDYAERIGDWRQRRGPTWTIGLKATQVRTLTEYGTMARLSAFLVRDLSPYVVEQLGTI